MQAAREFVAKVNEVILFPLITLMAGVALLYFLYGAFLYVLRADSETERAKGSSHMLWGIVGLVVMFSAYAILSIAAGTFQLQDELDCANQGIGC